MRAGSLNCLGNSDNLLLGFHRARACDQAEVSAADLHAVHIDNGILGMEFAVCALKGFGYALNRFHDVKACNKVGIHLAGIADQTEHGLEFSLRNMYAESETLEPVNQLCLPVSFHMGL